MAKKRKTAAKAPTVLRLRITLAESLPEIWRDVFVSPDTKLDQLHRIIQTVMPWDNSFPHSYIDRDGKIYSPKGSGQKGTIDESTISIDKLLDVPRAKITYQYDPTDCWDHVVELMKRGPLKQGDVIPRCSDGVRAAPPEGSGGIWGYAEMLAALKDPRHSLHAMVVDFAGANYDADELDLGEINQNLRSLQS